MIARTRRRLTRIALSVVASGLVLRKASSTLLRWKQKLRCRLIDLGDEEPLETALRAELKKLKADEVSHPINRSLFEHLAGTAALLDRWSSPKHIVRAAYFHGIYATNKSPNAVLTYSHRDLVRSVIGTEAERLVFLFSTVDKLEFLSLIGNQDAAGKQEAPIRIENGNQNGGEIIVTHDEACSLLLIYAATLAEQAGAPGRNPVVWLSEMHELAVLIRSLDGPQLPFYQATDAGISRSQETSLLRAYQTEMIGKNKERLEEGQGLPEAWIGELWIWRAFWASCRGSVQEAIEHAELATQKLLRLGTAWDNRLSYEEWLFIADALRNQNAEIVQAMQHRNLIRGPEIMHELLHHRIDSPSHLLPALMGQGTMTSSAPRSATHQDAFRAFMGQRAMTSVAPGSSTHQDAFHALMGQGAMTSVAPESSIQQDASRVIRYLQQLATPTFRTIGQFPAFSRQVVWNPSEFPFVQALEASAQLIRAEVESLNSRFFHDESERIQRDGSWEVFMLFERGRKNLRNCAQCPVITRIIERYDTMRTLGGLIYISRLGPQTRIKRHCGPTNLRLRCHFGLQVPDGDCAIRVGDEVLSWDVGKCIVFDDSVEHEAWNNTDSDRIVLIVDIWHPDLSEYELPLVKGLHRYAYLQAESLQRYWTANEAKLSERRSQYD